MRAPRPTTQKNISDVLLFHYHFHLLIFFFIKPFYITEPVFMLSFDLAVFDHF